jgi:methionine-gamma-lyase
MICAAIFGFGNIGGGVLDVIENNQDQIRRTLPEGLCIKYILDIRDFPDSPYRDRIVHDIDIILNDPDIKVVCDNTFASPALQNPLTLGADVVVHSATKYLNGHGDVIAGFVVGKSDFIKEVRMFGLKDMTGAVLDPFAAFLILRGLKTFELRMQRHCESARVIAKYLSKHPAVEKVYYPGLPGHPGHRIARKQMKDYGGMISFEVRGGKDAGIQLVNSLKMITVAVSLGDAESLIEHPASMTHSAYSPQELEESGIAPGLIRLSVCLENVEDILRDLDQALAGL